MLDKDRTFDNFFFFFAHKLQRVANFRTFLTEFGGAEGAAMRSNPIMLPHVDLQRALLRERPAADGALHKQKRTIERSMIQLSFVLFSE